MKGRSYIGVLVLIVCLNSLLVKYHSYFSDDEDKIYIIYTDNTRNNETSLLLHYKSLLQQVTKRHLPKTILQYYKKSFSVFVAKLTKEEANKMAGLKGVVSVFLNQKSNILTTKSWDFIGLTQYVEREYYESDVVVGVIDSGIWPESSSFDDKGFGPLRNKWNDSCIAFNFSCNRKIIGAKYYLSTSNEPLSQADFESPRDSKGHGTHTASTAAGNPVTIASMLGLAQGTTRFAIPSARTFVYKVCWSAGCFDESILAAFDEAVLDGVDILSVSLRSDSIDNTNHFKDVISIGAFHAMRQGVLTVVAGGNFGPRPASLHNLSPWTIVVGASTLDRRFITAVKLGDNRTYEGVSLNAFDLEETLYPIIFGEDASNTILDVFRRKSRFWKLNNTLDVRLVKGKIVLCEGKEGVEEAFRVGAIGILMYGPTLPEKALSYPLPACFLQTKDVTGIFKYISSTRNPVATILKTYELNDTLAPVVVSFSSRGPNTAISEILKPDLIAPGVNILSSWPSNLPISNILGETRKSEFNIKSGTSMSCPHVSGAAAYFKSFHPTWSPAAIRSALMTTAKKMSPVNNRDAEFGYGAGEVDAVKALHPGLVYDADEEDYIKLLCGHGFNTTAALQLITGDNSSCSEITPGSARDLNYPSFALKAAHPKQHVSGRFHRIVTNVGTPFSTYRAIVTAPRGLHIYVIPSVLSFTSLGENHTYVVIVDGVLKKSMVSASLTWDDGYFNVRSPIVIFDERAERVATSSTLRNVVIITVVVIFFSFAIIIIRYKELCIFL
ncbi:unnamed protein product [Vicia faba]|uniref:Cucumisin n=1 Tax=Vicia faba TaxID=3906 RepID=A0AAV0YNJ7_VICFA|nr:unnamed protein product [Vicia faba]